MLDAPGDYIVPIGVRVEVGGNGFFTLANRQNVIVIEQVTWLARRRVSADQPCQLFCFLPQFVGQTQRVLPMRLGGDN